MMKTKTQPEIPTHWTREQKINALLYIADRLSNKTKLYDALVSLQKEDIWSVAAAAITTAVDQWDNSRGVTLGAFANQRAVFAVSEEIRSMQHTSRWFWKKGQRIKWLSLDEPNYDDSEHNPTYYKNLDFTNHQTTNITLGTGFEQLVLDDVEIKLLYKMIDALPEKYRNLMKLYASGVRVADIATEKQIKDHTVYQLLREAKSLLKTMYDRTEIMQKLYA